MATLCWMTGQHTTTLLLGPSYIPVAECHPSVAVVTTHQHSRMAAAAAKRGSQKLNTCRSAAKGAVRVGAQNKQHVQTQQTVHVGTAQLSCRQFTLTRKLLLVTLLASF